MKISLRYRDQPKKPIDTAIYWVEYVIRHKGAHHMHSSGQDLSFLQYHNLDILLTLVALVVVLNFIVSKCCYGNVKKSEQKKIESFSSSNSRKKKYN